MYIWYNSFLVNLSLRCYISILHKTAIFIVTLFVIVKHWNNPKDVYHDHVKNVCVCICTHARMCICTCQEGNKRVQGKDWTWAPWSTQGSFSSTSRIKWTLLTIYISRCIKDKSKQYSAPSRCYFEWGTHSKISHFSIFFLICLCAVWIYYSK